MPKMTVIVKQEVPWTELEERIRQVPLKAKDADGNQIFPYANARISLRSVHPEELAPSSFYIIERNLQLQRDLRAHLLCQGYDSLSLRGALELETPESLMRLLPPVVEVMHERIGHHNDRGDIDYSGKTAHIPVHIITDGMHRAALARELNTSLTVIHISNIPHEHPIYALPNGWDQVRVFTDVPKTMEEKKFYRRRDSYALYRDFDVLGCGKPRGTGSGQVKR